MFLPGVLPDPCRVAVELGSQGGRWAKRFLRYVPDAKLFCVDPWDVSREDDLPLNVGTDPYTIVEWNRNVKPWLSERVWGFRGKSWDVVKKWPLAEGSDEIDLLFIDGDHRTKAVYRDLTSWVPFVREGGLVVGHDWSGARWGQQVQAGVKWWADVLEDQCESVPEIRYGFLVPSKRKCFWFYR
jgi:hypothetical protein